MSPRCVSCGFPILPRPRHGNLRTEPITRKAQRRKEKPRFTKYLDVDTEFGRGKINDISKGPDGYFLRVEINSREWRMDYQDVTYYTPKRRKK